MNFISAPRGPECWRSTTCPASRRKCQMRSARSRPGARMQRRTLYSDDEETLLDAMRPIIINGIDDIVTRADLADRSIFLTLDPIPEDKRRVEAEFFAEFEAHRPQIFGALLDGLVVGLAKLATTKLDGHPRMADFAKWATACETAYWPAGSFSSRLRHEPQGGGPEGH